MTTPGRRLLSPERATALRDVLTVFAITRVFIWIVGIVAALLLVPDANRLADIDPAGWATPFDTSAFNTLVAPGVRFDSTWFLEISHNGYVEPATPAFFPLYPALVALFGNLLGSHVIAGLLISVLASIGALYLVHRLVTLDFGRDVARRTVWLMSCFPTAFTFSAVYTEGLFLLLSVGSIYAGRLGRWPAAAAAAALAASTRSVGLLLVVPLAVLYLYGPRADREPDHPSRGLRPTYRLRPSVLVVAAPIVGLAAFSLYLGLKNGDPLAMLDAQDFWDRSLDPLGAIYKGAAAAGAGLIDVVAGTHVWNPTSNPRRIGEINILLFGSLVLGCWLAYKSWRLLPRAYTLYAIVAIALPLSSPSDEQPLLSMPRFLMVTFPLWITLALLVPDERKWRRILATSLLILGFFTFQFAGWQIAP